MPMTFERSPDTDAVVIALRGANLEIAYQSIAQQTGLPLKRVMGVTTSARRILENEGVLFGAVRGVGLRRLSDLDKVKQPEDFKKRVFRGAGRALKRLDTISNFEDLSQTDRHSVVTNKTVLNVIRSQAHVKPEVPKPKTAPQPMANVANITKLVKKSG